jgi:hypothetical protein
VAPPKRKTGGGRTTPKGTRPGEQRIANPTENERGVHASTRYTPPVTSEMRMPKPWVPYLMIGLFVVGMILIMVKNLGLVDTNWLTLVGLGVHPGWAVHRHQVALTARDRTARICRQHTT